MPRCPQNPGRRSPARPCWSGTGHKHTPECHRGWSCRTERRSDSRPPPSLSRVTPPAASEHFLELLGCPISRSLTTSCVCLELRTSLPRHYPASSVLWASPPPQCARPVPHGRPVDHPCSRIGASRVACAFLVYMPPPVPRCSGWA